ncbi:MAG: AmmeMemoRadiSam system protein B, partial [Anaerolineae bacterium]
MPVRMPVVAGAFYPAAPAACRREVELCLQSVVNTPFEEQILAGVVPHAGWVYSGSTAARVFAAIASQLHPETIILFGAVHHWGVNGASLYPEGSWRTPLGDVAIDAELSRTILDAAGGLVASSAAAHDGEHSIEVQLPFIQYLLPEAQIVPIAVPPEATALTLGLRVARAVQKLGRPVVVIASSDLTHYGPRYGFAPVGIGQRGLDYAHKNDAQLLQLAENLQAEELLLTANHQRSACGAGAIAAAIT